MEQMWMHIAMWTSSPHRRHHRSRHGSGHVAPRHGTHLLEEAELAVLVDGQRHALGHGAHAVNGPGLVHIVELLVVEGVAAAGVVCEGDRQSEHTSAAI